MPKKRDIATLLKARIGQGDYVSRPFPSTAQLATELQIDRRTASKAMTELVNRGVLRKTQTGRFKLSRHADGKMRLAVLAPAYPSTDVAERFAVLEQLVAERGWDIRLVGFHHDQDPIIFETIDRFDALFLVALRDEFSEDVIAKLKTSATKAVALFNDHSRHNLPSLRSENDLSMGKPLEHLYELGHRNVACLNTQCCGRIIQGRIDCWQACKQRRGLSGPLINEPVPHFGDAIAKARQIGGQCIDAGRFQHVDAIYCTTGAAALGLMRAMADRRLTPGRDIAVCAADGEGRIAQYLSPSLTHVMPPREQSYLNQCLDWFADGEAQWRGPLLVQMEAGELFIGESTVPGEPFVAESGADL